MFRLLPSGLISIDDIPIHTYSLSQDGWRTLIACSEARESWGNMISASIAAFTCERYRMERDSFTVLRQKSPINARFTQALDVFD